MTNEQTNEKVILTTPISIEELESIKAGDRLNKIKNA